MADGSAKRAMRAVVRFAASVMMVSGVLLIANASVTLLWQEPFSAVVAEREQGQLEEALADPPERVVERRPLPGDAIAKIEIPAIGVSEYVVEGTGTADLRKGPGHYPETPLPGQPGTTAIAGHRTTYGAPFRDIDQLERGDLIALDTPGGRYRYRVERTTIVDDQDLSVLDPVGYKRLILSACHPLYSAEQRVIAFARQVGHRSVEGMLGTVSQRYAVSDEALHPARDDRPRSRRSRDGDTRSNRLAGAVRY